MEMDEIGTEMYFMSFDTVSCNWILLIVDRWQNVTKSLYIYLCGCQTTRKTEFFFFIISAKNTRLENILIKPLLC